MTAQPKWSPEDWSDCWALLSGAFVTLKREGAETSYRAVLTRFDSEHAANAIMEWVNEATEEPTPADLAASIRRLIAAETRRPVVADDDEPVGPAPTDYRDAYRIAKQRRERDLSLGFGQYLMVTDDTAAQRAADLLAGNGPRQADGHGYGAILRNALRACDDADRDGALRRLRKHMTPDDHVVLTDAVTP
jgi:hypothetical protein